jgi:2-C-methyl-D-erythritol 4-phosphate cytidylyltransferase
MGGEVPKQFLPLGRDGKPVLVHTVERFLAAMPEGLPVVVVIPEMEMNVWQLIARKWNVWEKVKTYAGGHTRYESVRNGLAAIVCDVVAIHDGVRPLVSAGLIERTFVAAEKYGSAIPCLHPVDSFRVDNGHGGTEVCDRASLLVVQTPQVFGCEAIRKAYENQYDTRFTDDAGVYEANGGHIHICEGERQNIKITSPVDMAIANTLIEI